MNDIQNIQKGEAELKDYYENETAQKALKKRRLKRMSEFNLVQEADLAPEEEK